MTDSDGRLTGIITFTDLHDTAFDTSQDSVMVAHDVARQRPATLLAEDDLETAVKAYATSGQVNLPVVEDHESRRLIGVAHEHDVVLAYHRALDQARAEERGEV